MLLPPTSTTLAPHIGRPQERFLTTPLWPRLPRKTPSCSARSALPLTRQRCRQVYWSAVCYSNFVSPSIRVLICVRPRGTPAHQPRCRRTLPTLGPLTSSYVVRAPKASTVAMADRCVPAHR